MGRLTDRFGIAAPVICGALALAAGYVAAGFSHSLMVFALVHILIGLGASATFGPLIADSSQWFTRRRGIAVAIVSSGNYFGGTIWPPVVQHFVATEGWRATHIGIGVFCALTMLPFLLALRRRPDGCRRCGGRLHRRHAARARPFAQRAAGGVVSRRSLLLRGDVDAAGPHRRLLRRSRLRRRARC
jgi:MFS family permease